MNLLTLKVGTSQIFPDRPMKKYVALTILVLLSITSALLEGTVETLPPRFVQINGLLIIVCTGVYLAWYLKVRSMV